MKVLHLWGDYSPNLFDTSHPLCLAHGVDSIISCRSFIENGAKSLPKTYALRHCKPNELSSMAIGVRGYRFVRRQIDSYRFSRMVKQKVASFDPDLLHVHFGTTGADLLKWGALPQKPLIVSFYGVDASASLNDAKIVQRYREMFSRNIIVHVLSEEVAERMRELGCPADRIVIGNLPVDTTNIPEIGSEKTGLTRYLIPARFVEKKGHAILLAAFKKLHVVRPKTRLTCFGYGSVIWLIKLVKDMGLNDVVDIIDNEQDSSFVEMYIDILRKHDVVMAPSIRSSTGDDEGGPALTLVMAQVAKKPVIVSDFPGAERSVRDGVEGRIVRSGDVDTLYNAMLEMEGNLSEWQRFGAAGRLRALNDFSENEYWRKLSEWYNLASGVSS